MPLIKRRKVITNHPALYVPAGGVAPDNPLTIFGASLIGWYLADTGVTTSGGNVTAVEDQSNANHDLANSGTVPFNATGLNSRPAFDFVAANDAALVATTVNRASNEVSVFSVASMNGSTAAFGGLVVVASTFTNDYNSNDCIVMTRDNATNAVLINENLGGGDPLAATAALSLDTPSRVGFTMDNTGGTAGTCTLYVDGASAGTDSYSDFIATTDTPGRIIIGNRWLSSAVGGAGWQGPISEVVVVDRLATAGELTSLDTWFQYKWGL